VRFHLKFGSINWVRLCSVLFWVATLVLSLRRGHALSAVAHPGSVLILLFIAQITADVSTSWYLELDGLRIKSWGRSQQIPYPDIVAVRPHIVPLIPGAAGIEIEYGKLGSALNPRGTVSAILRERAAFLAKLRASTPQAVFEL